jgi:hypothetical protein
MLSPMKGLINVSECEPIQDLLLQWDSSIVHVFIHSRRKQENGSLIIFWSSFQTIRDIQLCQL